MKILRAGEKKFFQNKEKENRVSDEILAAVDKRVREMSMR
jgi:hypothetical protein